MLSLQTYLMNKPIENKTRLLDQVRDKIDLSITAITLNNRL